MHVPRLANTTLVGMIITSTLIVAVSGVTLDAHAVPREPANLHASDMFGGPPVPGIMVRDSLLDRIDEQGAESGVSFGGTDMIPETGTDFGSACNEDQRATVFSHVAKGRSETANRFSGIEGVYVPSNYAVIEFDQKDYTWTDKVLITVVAPNHNFDSGLIDEIGGDDLLTISTRDDSIDYKLAETGPDTGVFTGEVILTGFDYDADGDYLTGTDDGYDVTKRDPVGGGPTGGMLPAKADDCISASFKLSEGETIVSSSLIRWNIGEIEWLKTSHMASGTGVIRVIDLDMNWNPEAADDFEIILVSDTHDSGIALTVTETAESSGVFEGLVFFSTSDAAGHGLRVTEGDTITAIYRDNTLPKPYAPGDELDITAMSIIGTTVPPLGRAPVSNLKVVDSFGGALDAVSVDQQVRVSADLANGQMRDQQFVYLVQVQDEEDVTVHLAWITGSVSTGQSFSPAVSWTPAEAGTYTATAFVWESVSNPTALSPPVKAAITVR